MWPSTKARVILLTSFFAGTIILDKLLFIYDTDFLLFIHNTILLSAHQDKQLLLHDFKRRLMVDNANRTFDKECISLPFHLYKKRSSMFAKAERITQMKSLESSF